MKKENRTHILARYFLVTAFFLVISLAVGVKLFDNTIVDSEEWNKKATEKLDTLIPIKPERGNLLSANGTILATNMTYYNVWIDYTSQQFKVDSLYKYVDALSDSLALYHPLRSAADWKKRLLAPVENEPDKSKRPVSYPLLMKLNHKELRRLRSFPFFNLKYKAQSGFSDHSDRRRVNPYGLMALRSIGQVGISQKDNCFHGLSGLEYALDSLLFGVPGVAKKVPLTTRYVNWTEVPPVRGWDITTTIDINMQDIVENELSKHLTYCDAEWGLAILMEVSTGNIRAISNLEKREGGRMGDYIQAMNPRPFMGFEPGSVVKTLSMLIALEDGIVTDINRVISTGSAFPYAGGRPITDSHSCSSMPVREVIERSSNIGMAKIITSRYGDNPGAYYSRIKKLGFLDPMNSGIASTRVPRFDSLANNRGGRIALSRQSYGYTTEIPPIYTLSIYNAIANDGLYVKPRLYSRLTNETTDTILPISYMGNGRACSPENARKLRSMLTSVVWGDHGTARLLRDSKVRIAGKTGTCYSVGKHGYDTSKKRLAFCGFFPAEDPKYSCIVLTYHPRQNCFGAASTSGTVLKNIALKMYSRGMLDNSSDYLAERADNPGAPVLMASSDERAGLIRAGLGVNRVKHFAASKAAEPHVVPSVIGHSVRDAIHRLETLGLEVTFSGSGYVIAQSVKPGEPAVAGSRIHLSLQK